jgi:predicted AAA+ superfamily ATPase
LYYFRKDTGLEVDFIQKYKSKVSLIEVKAKSGKTKSSAYILNEYEKYHVDQLIKLSSNNIGHTDNIYTIPYYLVSFLFR